MLCYTVRVYTELQYSGSWHNCIYKGLRVPSTGRLLYVSKRHTELTQNYSTSDSKHKMSQSDLKVE